MLTVDLIEICGIFKIIFKTKYKFRFSVAINKIEHTYLWNAYFILPNIMKSSKYRVNPLNIKMSKFLKKAFK